MDNKLRAVWLTDNLERDYGELDLSGDVRQWLFNFLWIQTQYLDVTQFTDEQLAAIWIGLARRLEQEIQVLSIMQRVRVVTDSKDAE